MTKDNLMARLQHLPQAAKLFLAGGVMALSFQPFPFGFIAWFGLVPLILAWMGTSEPLRGAYLGFMWALGFLFGLIYWLAFNSGTVWWAATVSMIASVLFLGLNYAFVGWWFVWLRNRWGSAALGMLPLLWTTVEYIRSFGPLGFPWIALANSQAEYLLPIQNAEITGIYGLSFWLVLVNVILVDLIRHRRYPIAIPALLAVFALPWLTGWWLLPREPVPTLRIGIVQPNTNALEKWAPEIRNQHFEQLNRLTRQVAADSPRIVFWPEAATPAYLRRGGASYLRQIQQNLRELQLTVVTGMPEYERTRAGEINYFNAVGLIDSTGIGQQYNKISLVPFGEYIPLSGWITGLKKLNLGQGNFTHGAEYTVFQAGSFPFSTGVCYETTMPHLYRTFVKAGATYLVGLVNDAWFGSTSEPYQHTAQFRYRAVEFRRPVVRSANTGISIVIDQRGKTVARLGLNREGVLIADIAPSRDETFYTRYGNLFAWLNVLAAAWLTVMAVRMTKTQLVVN